MHTPTYHAPVTYRAGGLQIRASAKFTRDADLRQIDLESLQVTHLNEQPLAHGLTVVVDAAELPADDYDDIVEQLGAQFPADEEEEERGDGYCEDVENERMALAWANWRDCE